MKGAATAALFFVGRKSITLGEYILSCWILGPKDPRFEPCKVSAPASKLFYARAKGEVKMSYKANAEKSESNVLPMSDGLDIESHIMIAIFRAAHPIVDIEEAADQEYLKRFAPDIDRLGRVLKCLGLAEESTQSAFGWKPTAHLVQIIVERAVRPIKASKKLNTKGESKLVDSLSQLAGVHEDDDLIDEFPFVFNVLNCLGLLRVGPQGGCKPTGLLVEAVVEGFFGRVAV